MMTSDEVQRQAVAARIRARAGLARGVVVLDPDLEGLETALKAANLMVVIPPAGLDDLTLKEQILPHRIWITRNQAEVIDEPAVYEYGVVSLRSLSVIEWQPTYEKNRTVQEISKALSRYGLWTRGCRFLLELKDDGNHRLQEVT